ncbi:MAG: VWA domain-containing protein [Nitrospinae bacterium]|nr:VWA domain-containing protein [Nitrospinota bacterium]
MKTKIAYFITALCFTIATAAWAEKVEKPFNRIVVIVDASGSFQDRISTALEQTSQLLGKIESGRDKRWDRPDEISIVSLDSQPSELWTGTKKQLELLKNGELKKLFAGRKAFANCTDVKGAFNVAAYLLNHDPVPAGKYIVTFSDLLDEPPLPTGGCRPVRRPSAPPEGIQWEKLSEATLVGFWVNIQEAQAWEEKLSQYDLAFQFNREANSMTAELPALKKAKRKITEEMREEHLEKAGNFFGSIFKVAGMFIAGFIVLIICISLLKRRKA